MKPKSNLLKMAGLMSFADLKEATADDLALLILSRHYLAGLAARELVSRLCRN